MLSFTLPEMFFFGQAAKAARMTNLQGDRYNFLTEEE
jgi:hypothetical protein